VAYSIDVCSVGRCRTALIGEAVCQIRMSILWKAAPWRSGCEISVSGTLAYYLSKRSTGLRVQQLDEGCR
jgi:hypothetical protein